MKLGMVTGVTLVCAFGAFACASTPPPTAKLASSEGAIRAAQELNADQTPAAQLHLKLARDQFGEGKKLMADGDNERAEYVFMRAESDADVAIAIAKEVKVRKEASDAVEQVQKARSQQMPQPTTATTPTSTTTTTSSSTTTAPTTNGMGR